MWNWRNQPILFLSNEHSPTHKFYIIEGYFTASGYPFDELTNEWEPDYKPVFTMSFSIQHRF